MELGDSAPSHIAGRDGQDWADRTGLGGQDRADRKGLGRKLADPEV
jgi:hypothetical protein